MPPPNADTVRAFFRSFLAQDRAAAERLVAGEFVFTSPQDDHIDRAAFFERCFPTAGDDVFVLYEYELEGGQRHRNAEVITVRDGRVTESQVFFGGRY